MDARGPDAREVLEEIADEQGWDEKSCLDLLLGFVNSAALTGELQTFLRGHAEFEKGQTKHEQAI